MFVDNQSWWQYVSLPLADKSPGLEVNACAVCLIDLCHLMWHVISLCLQYNSACHFNVVLIWLTLHHPCDRQLPTCSMWTSDPAFLPVFFVLMRSFPALWLICSCYTSRQSCVFCLQNTRSLRKQPHWSLLLRRFPVLCKLTRSHWHTFNAGMRWIVCAKRVFEIKCQVSAGGTHLTWDLITLLCTFSRRGGGFTLMHSCTDPALR